MHDTKPEACARGVWRLGAAELARRIAAGELSSVDVVAAHIARIEAVNPRLNALVVPTLDEALRAAERADERLRRGEVIGPLHGVPFTVKECYHVAGTPATIGIERFREDHSAADGPLVASLRRAGGILLGKTNVPQLMLFYETDNPVYGRTNHPWDVVRSPGGSSGGEAALIAAGGSPFGLGTDLGGSIRQPAHSCGIHGFLPTPGRLTTDGMRTNLPHFDALQVQPGFLARHVADLSLAMRAVTGEAWAAHSIAGLRIGYWTDDGYMSPSPAIIRAVSEGAAALRSAGAVVEPFTPPPPIHAMHLFFALLSADGGDGFRELLGNSPRDPRVARLIRLSALPQWLHRLAVWFARCRGRRRLADILEHTGRRSAEGWQQLIAARHEFVSQFQQAMADQRLEVLICPPHTVPALRHGISDNLPNAASYCMVMNVLGWPCGVVAASQVRPGEESDRPQANDPSDRAAARVESDSTGLPVGVQVAAPAGNDQRVISVMTYLESHFRSTTGYPVSPEWLF